jgi:hypothetical protein
VLSLKAQWNQQESLGPKEMAKVQVICSDVKRKIAGLEKLGAVDAQLKAYDISSEWMQLESQVCDFIPMVLR